MRGILSDAADVTGEALTIAVRLRDPDDAVKARARLLDLDRASLISVTVLLAELVDVDRPASELLAWKGTGAAAVVQCGTVRGYHLHKAYGRPSCTRCRAAYDAAKGADDTPRPPRPAKPKRQVQPCGTPAGYQRHYSKGGDRNPCLPCRQAWKDRYKDKKRFRPRLVIRCTGQKVNPLNNSPVGRVCGKKFVSAGTYRSKKNWVERARAAGWRVGPLRRGDNTVNAMCPACV